MTMTGVKFQGCLHCFFGNKVVTYFELQIVLLT